MVVFNLEGRNFEVQHPRLSIYTQLGNYSDEHSVEQLVNSLVAIQWSYVEKYAVGAKTNLEWHMGEYKKELARLYHAQSNVNIDISNARHSQNEAKLADASARALNLSRLQTAATEALELLNMYRYHAVRIFTRSVNPNALKSVMISNETPGQFLTWIEEVDSDREVKASERHVTRDITVQDMNQIIERLGANHYIFYRLGIRRHGNQVGVVLNDAGVYVQELEVDEPAPERAAVLVRERQVAAEEPRRMVRPRVEPAPVPAPAPIVRRAPEPVNNEDEDMGYEGKRQRQLFTDRDDRQSKQRRV